MGLLRHLALDAPRWIGIMVGLGLSAYCTRVLYITSDEKYRYLQPTAATKARQQEDVVVDKKKQAAEAKKREEEEMAEIDLGEVDDWGALFESQSVSTPGNRTPR